MPALTEDRWLLASLIAPFLWASKRCGWILPSGDSWELRTDSYLYLKPLVDILVRSKQWAREG